MVPPFKRLNNESGVVLFMVLMTAIIIMILSIGILTQSINEVNYAQQQIDQIISDQLSKGIFWSNYSSSGMGSSNNTTPLQGRTYTTTISSQGANASNPAITGYTVNTTYDTF